MVVFSYNSIHVALNWTALILHGKISGHTNRSKHCTSVAMMDHHYALDLSKFNIDYDMI